MRIGRSNRVTARVPGWMYTIFRTVGVHGVSSLWVSTVSSTVSCVSPRCLASVGVHGVPARWVSTVSFPFARWVSTESVHGVCWSLRLLGCPRCPSRLWVSTVSSRLWVSTVSLGVPSTVSPAVSPGVVHGVVLFGVCCPRNSLDQCGTGSAHTRKVRSSLAPKLLLMATSAASRPRAISSRPVR